MAGYSGTPLAKKLGIAEGMSVWTIGAPPHYRELLVPLPGGVTFTSALTKETAIIHLFATRRGDLEKQLRNLRKRMPKDAAAWVSWPKKSSRVETDITEDVIRDVALPMGLVDVKVCAVDEVWSGLKLVIRRELR
jgi:hypothetical protein